MKKIVGLILLGLMVGQAATLKDFSGYWMVDMAKTKETMTAEEKAEISKMPEVMRKMAEAIVIQIEDKSMSAFIMSKVEKQECNEYKIQGNELNTSCKLKGSTKFIELNLKLDDKWLFVSQPNIGKGEMDNFAFMRVSDTKAQTIIKSQPTQKDLQKMMMKMMLQNSAGESGGLKITP
jgi:hypothetical protein